MYERWYRLDVYPYLSYSHSLFCQSYDAHRALHSFPTRRSSDLDPSPVPRPPSPAPRGVPLGLPQCTDRKSTRLNSSHLGISYAVCCLKKKKPVKHKNLEKTIIVGSAYFPEYNTRHRVSVESSRL